MTMRCALEWAQRGTCARRNRHASSFKTPQSDWFASTRIAVAVLNTMLKRLHIKYDLLFGLSNVGDIETSYHLWAVPKYEFVIDFLEMLNGWPAIQRFVRTKWADSWILKLSKNKPRGLRKILRLFLPTQFADNRFVTVFAFLMN